MDRFRRAEDDNAYVDDLFVDVSEEDMKFLMQSSFEEVAINRPKLAQTVLDKMCTLGYASSLPNLREEVKAKAGVVGDDYSDALKAYYMSKRPQVEVEEKIEDPSAAVRMNRPSFSSTENFS